MAVKEHYLSYLAYTGAEVRPAIASPEDYAFCRLVMRAASKNYTYASLFLPAGQRPFVEALYAFFRVGDDRVDVSHAGFASKHAAIDDWEHTYWRAFEMGGSAHPVMRAYLDTALRFNIPGETMTPYFRSMREDLTITRFPTFDALLHYIEGSALPVGRAMTHIMGVRAPYQLADALSGADSLSTAMQLSNFWRDIAEDWRLGRVYLPQEDMERFGVSEGDIAAGQVRPQLIELLEFEIERTEGYYQHAHKAVPMLAHGRWGVQCGLEAYRAILTGIRRQRFDVFSRRAGLGKLDKIALSLHAWWDSR
jgi:phytoene synthase